MSSSFLALLLLLGAVKSINITYLDATYNISFTPIINYTATSNSAPYFRPSTQSNSYQNILDSSGIISTYSRSDPSATIFTTERYNSSQTNQGVIAINAYSNDSMLVVTVFNYNMLMHYTANYALGSWSTVNTYSKYVGTQAIPDAAILNNDIMFSYFKNAGGDRMHIFQLNTYTQTFINMNISNYNIAFIGDRSKAFLWSSTNSELYVYSMNPSLTLQHHSTTRLTPSGNVPANISFSYDSQLAILQYDDVYPTIILDTTDFSTRYSITVTTTIYSANFLDIYNRFVLMQTAQGDRIYDLQASLSTYHSLSLNFNYQQISIDHDNCVLYAVASGNIEIYGINIIIDNSTIVAQYPKAVNTTTNSTNSTTNSTTNATTNSTSNSTNQTTESSNQTSPYFVSLSYNKISNTTLFYLNNAGISLNKLIQYSFAVIFSSPMAIYFLGTFNYFNLGCLYILMNVRVPQVIFDYFGPMYQSVQTNALKYVNFPEVASISEEKVSNSRAIYFGVGSDLLSGFHLDFLVIIGNVVLIECCILLAHRKCLNIVKVHQFFSKERINMYFGLLASNMVQLILPWRFSFFGGDTNDITLLNSGTRYLLLCFLGLILVFSFLYELKQAKKLYISHHFKISLRKWWSGYQNFIYPILIINYNPNYFLITIGIHQLVYLINSLMIPNLKKMSIVKAFYPICFHTCYLIFYLSEDNDALAITSIACISVFLLGSLHHLLESAFMIIRAIYRVLSRMCSQRNKVTPSSARTINSQMSKNVRKGGRKKQTNFFARMLDYKKTKVANQFSQSPNLKVLKKKKEIIFDQDEIVNEAQVPKDTKRVKVKKTITFHQDINPPNVKSEKIKIKAPMPTVTDVSQSLKLMKKSSSLRKIKRTRDQEDNLVRKL